jgi:anti-sigma factor RsiW
MSKISENLLNRYYDGDLKESKAKKVEAFLAGSEEAQKRLNDISRISEYITIMHNEQIKAADFDGFDKRVLNMIETKQSKTPFVESVKVWLLEFLRYRKKIWIPATSVVAAAALMLFIVTAVPANRPDLPFAKGITAQTWQASTSESQTGSEVKIISAGNMNGKEYNLRNANGETIGVVWIQE